MQISDEQTINYKKHFCVHFVGGGGSQEILQSNTGEQQKDHT